MKSHEMPLDKNELKLLKVASVITHFRNVYAVVQERVRQERKIKWLDLTDEQLSRLDGLLQQCRAIAAIINQTTHHPDFDDVLALGNVKALTRLQVCLARPALKAAMDSAIVTTANLLVLITLTDSQLNDLNSVFMQPLLLAQFKEGQLRFDRLLRMTAAERKRLMNPVLQEQLVKKRLHVDEVLQVESLNSEIAIEEYLQAKREREKLYAQLGLELSELDKAKLSIFDDLFISKSFGKHPRAKANLRDVLALTNEERDKIHRIIPGYLNLFFFTDTKMPIAEVLALSRDEKNFIDAAIMNNNEDVLAELQNGRFRNIYPAENKKPASDTTPLLNLNEKIAGLIESLLKKLNAYIARIDAERDPNNLLFPNFKSGFKYFVDWQAENRRATYHLAKELVRELQADDPDLPAIFTRKNIRDLRFKHGKPSPNHGINSDDMNEVLKEARRFIWRNKLKARVQPEYIKIG